MKLFHKVLAVFCYEMVDFQRFLLCFDCNLLILHRPWLCVVVIYVVVFLCFWLCVDGNVVDSTIALAMFDVKSLVLHSF